MRNYKFWAQGSNNVLWNAVKRFVENHGLTCGLEDEVQELYMGDLVDLIEEVKDTISREVDNEYYREDVLCFLEEKYETVGEKFRSILPLETLNKVVETWQDNLQDNENYAETRDRVLEDELYKQSWMAHFDEYEDEDVQLYLVYLQDWFSNHNEGAPVCIEEFLNNEMQDEDLAMFYKGLAEKKKIN